MVPFNITAAHCVFSRVHATLKVTVSVRPSVRPSVRHTLLFLGVEAKTVTYRVARTRLMAIGLVQTLLPSLARVCTCLNKADRHKSRAP